MATKTLTATVSGVAMNTVMLEVDGTPIGFPRAQLPTALRQGDNLTIRIDVDRKVTSRESVEEDYDNLTARRVGGRKRGNPLNASTRTKKR